MRERQPDLKQRKNDTAAATDRLTAVGVDDSTGALHPQTSLQVVPEIAVPAAMPYKAWRPSAPTTSRLSRWQRRRQDRREARSLFA
jgi:hypothetical protein